MCENILILQALAEDSTGEGVRVICVHMCYV